MATSGSFNTNSTSWTDSYGTLTSYVNVAWAQVGQQDITNNTTTIRITCTVYTNMTSGYRRGYYTKRLTVDGQTVDDTTYITRGNGEVLWTRDFTISHTADGSKSFSISFAVCVGQNNTWTLTGSGTYTLNTIPRASSMSMSPANPTTLSTVTATIERAVSTFKHTITTVYNGTTYNLTGSNKVDTSATFTIPIDLRKAMATKNVASVVLPITLTTYNGDNAIGQKEYSLTVSVPTATVSTTASSVSCNANVTWNLANTDTNVARYTVERLYSGTVVYTDQAYNGSNNAGAVISRSVANALFQPKITSTPASGTVTVRVTTYSGTTVVGSSTATYTVTIPTDYYKPTLTLKTGITKSKNKQYTSTSWTDTGYLSGYDGATFALTEGYRHGSSAPITSRTVSLNAANRTTASISVSGSTATVTLSTFTSAASDVTVNITYTVTDSRGGTASYTFENVKLLGYSAPRITSASALRATSNGTADVQGTYANLSANAESHSTSVPMSSLVINSSTGTRIVTGTVSGKTGTASVTGQGESAYQIAAEYEFTVIATDNIGISSSFKLVLPKATVTLSLHKENGIGLGTVAEKGYVDVALPLRIPTTGTQGKGIIDENNVSIIRRWDNKNVTVDACNGTLYLGFQSTNGINILNGKTTIDSNGNFVTKGYGTFANLIGITTSVDASKANNNVSSITYPTTMNITDSANRIIARAEAVVNPNGSIGMNLYARNYNTSGTQVAQKGLQFHVNKSGALSWIVSDPDNFVAAIKSSIVNAIYPVGSIYMSVNSTSPATLFGGTWVQLKDRFLLGRGSTYSNGATGGEATHKLTVNEMPKHTHSIYYYLSSGSLSFGYNFSNKGAVSAVTVDSSGIGITGGDVAHNNMPPYLVVYMWKRTA